MADGSEENGDNYLSLTAEELIEAWTLPLKIAKRKEVDQVKRKYNGRSVIRIGSWNLLSFTKRKAMNPGIREVICMTILENGISILAAQELAEEGALELIRDELNNPTTPNVKNWKGHRGKWECVTSHVAGRMYRSMECNGFLYDTSRNVQLTDHGLLKKKQKIKGEKADFARKPFFGYFKVYRFDFVILSVHLKATGLNNEDLTRLEVEIDRIPDISEAIEDSMPGEDDIIVVGDFNLTPKDDVFDDFRKAGFKNAIADGTHTNISVHHLDGNKTYDNIWIKQSGRADRQEYSGRSGVGRDNQTHEWISWNEWNAGGTPSDHCMVWAEFFYGKDYDESSGKEQLNLRESKRYKMEECDNEEDF